MGRWGYAINSVLAWSVLAVLLSLPLLGFPAALWVVLPMTFLVDVFLLDGYLLFRVARAIGGKATLERHIHYVATWKPPLFVLQFVFFLADAFQPLFFMVLIEVCFFYRTFRGIHAMPVWKAIALSLGVFAVILMFFISPPALSFFDEVLKVLLNVP